MENGSTIEILFEGLKREFEQIKRFDEEDGIDVNAPNYRPNSSIADALFAFEQYRKIRIEQAYFSKMPNDLSSRQRQERLVEYDHSRRRCHDTALSSLNILNRTLERLGLSSIYKGKPLSDDEITKHTNLDARRDYTDFFLDLLIQVEDIAIGRLEEVDKTHENQSNESTRFARDIVVKASRDIGSTTRGFGLVQPVTQDDGDIIFDDEDSR